MQIFKKFFFILKIISILSFILINLDNCVVKLPPITFTQSGTAAEKQMIGDEKNIEKDGWILSSVKTSAIGSNVWKREKLDSDISITIEDGEYLLHIKRLSYYAPEMKLYLSRGFIAESLSGKIVLNPLIKQSRYNSEYSEYKSRIEEALKLINESRDFIYKKKISYLEKTENKPDKIRQKSSEILLTYYNLASEGDFIEISRNKWARKN